METRQKVIISVCALALAFATGRYTVPEKIKVETKIVEVEKKTENKKEDVNQNKHKETKTVIVEKPTGEKETTTTTVEDTKTDKSSDTAKNDTTTKDSTENKDIKLGDSKVTVSALAGVQYSVGTGVAPVYGACVSKPIIGPVTVGLWGLSNASGGVSVGLTF